jgi:hypothetical protein
MTAAAANRPGRLELPLIRWSDTEDDFLRRYYQTTTMRELRRKLRHRTKSAIVQRAGVLDLWGNKCLENAIPWSDEERAVLSMYYPDNGIDLCKAFLPDRSRNSAQIMVKRMGLLRKRGPRSNQISAQEWAFVMDNVERLGFVVCAEKIGDTPDNLRDKCSRKGIDCDAVDLVFNGKDFRVGDFSEDEIEYITRHFPHQGGVRVALALGRAPKTLINYAKRRLGLKTQPPTLFPNFSVTNPVFSLEPENR